MSSNETSSTFRGDQWPNEESSANKRRRIAFSCLDCRRRKLKCDRTLPSCTRCQRGGHPETCSYDLEAVGSRPPRFTEDGQRSTRESLPATHESLRVAPYVPPVARNSAAEDGENPVVRERPSEDAMSRLYLQEASIRQLETRINALEREARGFGSREPWLNSSRIRDPDRDEARSAEDKGNLSPEESMVFKGRHFKTQFFGASHPASYLFHVCLLPWSYQ